MNIKGISMGIEESMESIYLKNILEGDTNVKY